MGWGRVFRGLGALSLSPQTGDPPPRWAGLLASRERCRLPCVKALSGDTRFLALPDGTRSGGWRRSLIPESHPVGAH